MTKELEKKEDDMILMRGILREVVKSEEYDGYNAKKYYERLTEISWKDESLELYEESLDRNEFVAHNTILTIFTDIDKNNEDRITKTVKTKGDNDMTTNYKDDLGILQSWSKKELKEEMTKRELIYRVRDTKANLINLLSCSVEIERDLEEAKKNIGIKTKEKTETEEQHKDEIVEIEDLINQICETATLRELILGTRTLAIKVKAEGKGLSLVKELHRVMESDFGAWIIENKAFVEEQNRKYEKIKKLKSAGKKSEDKTPKEKEKKKAVVSKDEETAILENLKGKKLTEEMLSGIGWRTLKKLAKNRGVKSFGKSKSYITKRLLRNKKK